jgi:calpain-7
MKEVLQRTPQTHQFASVRNLLEEKIEFYSVAASKLYFDDTSTAPTIVSNPRSPTMGQQKFFIGGSKVESPRSAMTCGSITQTAELNRMAGQANTELSLAMDLDESGENTDTIIEAYTTAAKLYLNTIRLSEAAAASSIAAVLKRRLEGALDRIEQLKKEPKSRFKQQPAIRKEPEVQSNTIPKSSYTEHEISVLKNSSLIASGLFLPWSDEDAQRLSLQTGRAANSPPLFSDNQLLKLSEKQKKVCCKWARPSEIIAIRESFWKKQQPPIMIQSVNQYSIRQQYVTDCSFVASLCICAAFEKRFRRRLVTPIIYPQNKDGVPIYNPSGKYIVKLWLNGVARQVVVDDRLPIDAHGRLLCSDTKTSNHRLELWVSIIEKAYMKLCGGYDFPGSNSGVDLFSLTGWIPERIFFPKNLNKARDFETEPERAWERLFSANSFGDCLITVSTTRDLDEAQAERLGLITGHAYAVLDVVQASDGTRLLQVRSLATTI